VALISEEYRREQEILHGSEAYGSRGFNWGFLVAGMGLVEGCRSILDYGCGKGTLVRTLTEAGLDCRGYDPAVARFAKPPQPADLVVSVDVLEHIEPETLDAVLDHIGGLTRKILFVAISTIPAKRFLTDGRNAHLIVEGAEFWRPRLEARGFAVRRVWDGGGKEWVAMLEIKR
jgi:2-polyprenyl-3-methyl-5-hydroxy-6-metoxy-1,4-benzoquinol methylase